MVKIVEVELSIDANDETTAATRAAKANPLIPAGAKFLNSQG